MGIDDHPMDETLIENDIDETRKILGEKAKKDSESLMAGLPSYTEYLKSHAGKTREQFLGEITDPHLIVTAVVDPDTDTQGLGILTLRGSEGMDDLAASAERDVAILPLRKRPGANTFGMMVTLGRADNNDLVLRHPMISKFHAYFRNLNNDWMICDANSANGTAIDRRTIPPERSLPLRSGTLIYLAKAVALEYVEPTDLYDLIAAM